MSTALQPAPRERTRASRAAAHTARWTCAAGWHWTEKDRKQWTKERLAELFAGLQLFCAEDAAEGEPQRLAVTQLKDVTGEVGLDGAARGEREGC